MPRRGYPVGARYSRQQKGPQSNPMEMKNDNVNPQKKTVLQLPPTKLRSVPHPQRITEEFQKAFSSFVMKREEQWSEKPVGRLVAHCFVLTMPSRRLSTLQNVDDEPIPEKFSPRRFTVRR